MTLQIGQGFDEVHEKLDVLDEKVENVRRIVSVEVKLVGKHEGDITVLGPGLVLGSTGLFVVETSLIGCFEF